MQEHFCAHAIKWSKSILVPPYHHGPLPQPFIQCRYLSVNSGIAHGLRETSKLEKSTRLSRRRSPVPSEERPRSVPKSLPYGAVRRSTKHLDLERESSIKDDTSQVDDALGFSIRYRNERRTGRSSSEKEKEVKVKNDYKGAKRSKLLDNDYEIPISMPYATAASVMIPGMRPVQAAFRAKRRKLYKLWMSEGSATRPEHKALLDEAKVAGVAVELVPTGTLDNMKKQLTTAGLVGKDGVPFLHDGVMLDASPLPQIPVKGLGFSTKYGQHFEVDLESQSKEEAEINGTLGRLSYNSHGWRQPFLIWLHGVVDTRNLGAVLRTAMYFAADGVILTKRGTASVTDPGAQKASAGASEFLPVLTVNSPSDFITASQSANWKFFAAVAPASGPTDGVTRLKNLADKRPLYGRPCVLVLGNEDEGLPHSLVDQMDERVCIHSPLPDALSRTGLDSLNVSVAAAILIEYLLRTPSQSALEKLKVIAERPRLRMGGNDMG